MGLLPEQIRSTLPRTLALDGLGMAAIAQAKLYLPGTCWTWYITEYDGDDTCFGLCIAQSAELVYFSLSKLEQIVGPLGAAVEKSPSFEPTALEDLLVHFQVHGKAL